MRGQAKTVIAKMKADHKAALEKGSAGGAGGGAGGDAAMAGGAGGGEELAEKQEEVDALKAQLEKVKTEARAYLEKQKKMHQEELARVVAEAEVGAAGAGAEEALRGEVVALQEDLKKTKLQVYLTECIY